MSVGWDVEWCSMSRKRPFTGLIWRVSSWGPPGDLRNFYTNSRRRYMTEVLPIRRKTHSNQSINDFQTPDTRGDGTCLYPISITRNYCLLCYWTCEDFELSKEILCRSIESMPLMTDWFKPLIMYTRFQKILWSISIGREILPLIGRVVILTPLMTS